MHEIEKFGGQRIDVKPFTLKVKFDTKAGMDLWLKYMRANYTTEQFLPFINEDELIVMY